MSNMMNFTMTLLRFIHQRLLLTIHMRCAGFFESWDDMTISIAERVIAQCIYAGLCYLVNRILTKSHRRNPEDDNGNSAETCNCEPPDPNPTLSRDADNLKSDDDSTA